MGFYAFLHRSYLFCDATRPHVIFHDFLLDSDLIHKQTFDVGSSPKKSSGPWNDWYHCMGHTYGTWLPGDPRSFRTRHHREHIEGDYKHPPPPGKYDERHLRTQSIMTREPVILGIEQRILIVRLMVESLQRRTIDVAVASMTDVHFHILARFADHNPRHWIGLAKKESSHHANQAGQGEEGGLWAIRSKALPINSRRHQVNTAKYIYDHIVEGGAVWYLQQVILPQT